MNELFRGWRQKFGVVTLLWACLFMAGWVRSLLRDDIVSINVFPQQIAAESKLGKIRLFRYENYVIWIQRGMPPIPLFQWETLNVSDAEPVVSDRIFDAAAMSLSNYGRDAVSPSVIKCVIPYWSIVIPLALISAFLLIKKPRNSTAIKHDAPIPDEGPSIMREFFQGWRRKVGVVTLLMACLFMAGWVRSTVTMDFLSFGQLEAYHVMVSTKAETRWARITPGLMQLGFEWNSSPLIAEDEDFQWQEGKVEWRRAFCGFDFGSGASMALPTHRTERWVFPYWSIVIPLTAISAFMLLSMPKTSTSKKSAEPVSVEGA